MDEQVEVIKKMLVTDAEVHRVGNNVLLQCESNSLTNVKFRIRPKKIIFPLREGELIDRPQRIPVGESYAISYPGTASTKCIVVYQDDINVFIGGVPSFEFTKIVLERVTDSDFHLTYRSKNHDYIIIPFRQKWEEAATAYRQSIGTSYAKVNSRAAKCMLQLGVKDGLGRTYIKHFSELNRVLKRFRNHFGPGHIVHFFGTNKHGFDRMFPDFTIDPALGGKESLAQLVDNAHRLGLQTSHHYIPRIADIKWICQNSAYKEAVVKKDGQPVVEHYDLEGNGGLSYYVMNLNNERWFSRCLEAVDYLTSIGFDYLEIDQVAYQRNFFHQGQPLAQGYQKLLDELVRRGIKFWVEGVSDVFRLPPGNFYQILIRNRCHLWEDKENRRGYAYGESYPDFFMSLWPDSEVSYQIFTENKAFDTVGSRVNTAKKINAVVHDIELGFHDQSYLPNFEKLTQYVKRSKADRRCLVPEKSPLFTTESGVQTASP